MSPKRSPKAVRPKVDSLPKARQGSPGRGGRTRGWKSASPKRGTARHSMHERCPHCFLMPDEEKFPICTADCRTDCRGITSAKVRSRQYGYNGVYNKAVAAEKKYGCKSPKSAKRTTKRKSATSVSPRKRRSTPKRRLAA